MKKDVLKILIAIVIIVLCVVCYEQLNNNNIVEIAQYI